MIILKMSILRQLIKIAIIMHNNNFTFNPILLIFLFNLITITIDPNLHIRVPNFNSIAITIELYNKIRVDNNNSIAIAHNINITFTLF